MKLVKSLMLGSVAGIAAVAGAQAADLPVKKAAPVEYVRVCSTYGAGFFYIPGTETCLRVGGRVRADYLYNEPFVRQRDAINFFVRGRVQLDARTATAYGLLRSVVRMEMNRTAGSATSANIAEAFIQFGGLTAGRVVSFFSNGDLPTGHMGTLRFDDAPDVDLLAYTFTFGNGFSATLSLEDRNERALNGYPGVGAPTAAQLVYAGQRMPDVVANVKYTGTWGTAQLSGAVHNVNSANLVAPFGTTFPVYPDSEYGWAVRADVGINLPMLAPGDAMWLAATYADGALSYLGFGNTTNSGNVTGYVSDAYINTFSGDIDKGKGWSVAGGLRHYWTPQIRQNVFGSYARVDYGAAASFLNPTGFYTGLNDFNEWRVGTNVFWQPVAGLDLGVEVIYANVDPRGRVVLPNGNTIGSDNNWEGRFRVQRDF